MADIQPPELAALVDVSERPRAGNWSLRAALTRYAQGQPRRVSDLLELVRRIEAALDRSALEKDGPAVWAALSDGVEDTPLLGMLRALQDIDVAGDALAVWADDISGDRPDALVDSTIASVRERLDAHGVPVEERVPPRGARRRG